MQFLNIFLCVALLVLIVLEGRRALKNYKLCQEAIKQVKDNKPNVVEIKDYVGSVIFFGIMIIFILAAGIYNIVIKDYFTAIMILGLIFFWFIFIIESICTKTILFYDSGFLYCAKQYKYRSVQSVEETKKFARGYKVNVIGGDEVYVSKRVRPIIEEKIKDQKERKKK